MFYCALDQSNLFIFQVTDQTWAFVLACRVLWLQRCQLILNVRLSTLKHVEYNFAE